VDDEEKALYVTTKRADEKLMTFNTIKGKYYRAKMTYKERELHEMG
jgi:hypothetical protein